ncbi:MAG: alkaline phosphatase [Gammaproteobacteria bacterium]|jgi:alkaline phosphatase|nr:alkaline phosphatase [Gammaproteobacteria bacterium]
MTGGWQSGPGITQRLALGLGRTLDLTLTRRQLHPVQGLILTGVLSLVPMLGLSSPAEPAPVPAPAPMPVRHLILFIGDGRHLAHDIATSRYLFGQDEALSYQRLPYRGQVATWDITTYDQYAAKAGEAPYDPQAIEPRLGYDWRQGGRAPYPLDDPPTAGDYFLTLPNPYATDSASAATAMVTGHKTVKGAIAWGPGTAGEGQGGPLPTLAELLRARLGFAIGIVSTVPFSHATPAALVSHSPRRDDFPALAAQILGETRPEVVIGGGFPGPSGTPDYQYLSRETHAQVKADPDYLVVERQPGVEGGVSLLEAAQVAAGSGRKLFGLFGGPQGSFESPLAHDLPGTPLLTRATVENPLLRDAVLAALRVLTQDPDGFLLLAEQGDSDWANHANDFRRMIGTVWDLHEAVQTVIDYVNRPGDGMTWVNTLLLVASDHATGYTRLAIPLGPGDLPRQAGEGSCGYASREPCTYPDGEVSYGATNHTNEPVPLYAAGTAAAPLLSAVAGTWYPGTDLIDNTQLFHVMAAAAGLPQTSSLKLKAPAPTAPAMR